MVRTAGLEPALPEGKQILSPLDGDPITFRNVPNRLSAIVIHVLFCAMNIPETSV